MEENGNTPEDLQKYSRYYSEDSFWKKLGKIFKFAGSKLVYYALVLYYTLMSDKVDKKDRLLIIGALGYLILPVDLIPDMIPVVGLTDDLAALVFAIFRVNKAVTPEIKEKARQKVYDLFGNVDIPDIDK